MKDCTEYLVTTELRLRRLSLSSGARDEISSHSDMIRSWFDACVSNGGFDEETQGRIMNGSRFSSHLTNGEVAAIVPLFLKAIAERITDEDRQQSSFIYRLNRNPRGIFGP